jgi:hypothetical protein
MDTRVLSSGVIGPGREVNHSPPSSAELRNAWSYTSTPPYISIAWCLVKQQGQLNLTVISLLPSKKNSKLNPTTFMIAKALKNQVADYPVRIQAEIPVIVRFL